VWFYLYKILVPVNLVIIYPRWDVDAGHVVAWLPLLLLLALGVTLWAYRNTWARGPLVALGCFVVMLLPVAGLVDMAFMSFSLVSDHLQYQAMPGAIALVAGLLALVTSRAMARWPGARALAAAAVYSIIVLVLGILTWQQASLFTGAGVLWSETLKH